jgi:thiamine kinase-like enzyme
MNDEKEGHVAVSNVDRVKALPLWSGPVAPRVLKGGLSNESYTVEDGGRRFVVRFGRDFPVHHVSRERELIASRAAHAAGFAPEVVYAEPGLMVTAFIEGRTYAEDDVRGNIARVAALARRFHEEMPAHVSGPGAIFWPFHVVRDYARTLEAGGSRMLAEVPRYLALAKGLEAAQVPLAIVFAHNDLLPANFIDDGERLWLIDFEYAAFSTAMFDLAGIASNALFSRDEDEELLARYFGAPPDAALLRSHAAMKCASLLREAMWSMVSEMHLDAPGVDYVAYTAQNLDRLARALEAFESRYGRIAA